MRLGIFVRSFHAVTGVTTPPLPSPPPGCDDPSPLLLPVDRDPSGHIQFLGQKKGLY